MPFLDGVTGRVYYRAWRARDPIASVVFLHGFGEHSGLYHRLAAALDRERISLWAIDEIGHGLSEGQRGYVESLDLLEDNARRLTAIAAAREPGVPIVLAGHSLGGITAALAGARASAGYAGLVLSGTPISPIDLPDEALSEGGGLDLEPSDLSGDEVYLDALEHDPLAFTGSETPPLAALPAAWDELARTFADVRLPVLFVHGVDDPLAPVDGARAWAQRLADGRVAEFDGARHDVLNETVHREVSAAIARFVGDTARAAPVDATQPATAAATH